MSKNKKGLKQTNSENVDYVRKATETFDLLWDKSVPTKATQIEALVLNDAELSSIVDIQQLSESIKVELKEFVLKLSIVLYKSFQNEES